MSAATPILLIQPPLIGAGFAACLLTVLNYVRYCEREGLTPVVHIDDSCCTRFLDSRYGDNVWEQYFEPVGPYSSSELQRMLVDPACRQIVSGLRRLDESLPAHIKAHPDSVFTWTFGAWRTHPPDDLRAWFAEQRRKGRDSVRRHVHIKPHVLAKLDSFFDREMRGRHVLGVHIRGTDLHYAPPVSPAEYFSFIDRYLEEHAGACMFLATDQVQYLEVMKKRYRGRVVSCDCLRSMTSTAPFEMKAGTPYAKGEDVLLDILLLSRCAHLVRGASNIPEMALYFGESLESTDLSLARRFAFGQDYLGRWSPRATRPAWDLLQNTDLETVAERASSQNTADRVRYELRRGWAAVRRTGKQLRRTLRRLSAFQKS